MRFLGGWEVGIKIRKHFPQCRPRSERPSRLTDFARPPVFGKQTRGRHVRATSLKFENSYPGFGKIQIIVAPVETAEKDVANDRMTAKGVLQLADAGFCFGAESGYLLRRLTTCQQNCGEKD